MNEAKLHPELYGLVELNQEGTVLYSRLDDAGASSDINGRNFFSEVAPFKNVEAFRQLVSNFTSGRDQANNFNFMCDFDDMTVLVRARRLARKRFAVKPPRVLYAGRAG